MRERFTVSKTVSMTPKMADAIQDAANEFNVSFADVVRGCIETDLPKLIERHRKRKQRAKRPDTRRTKDATKPRDT